VDAFRLTLTLASYTWAAYAANQRKNDEGEAKELAAAAAAAAAAAIAADAQPAHVVFRCPTCLLYSCDTCGRAIRSDSGGAVEHQSVVAELYQRPLRGALGRFTWYADAERRSRSKPADIEALLRGCAERPYISKYFSGSVQPAHRLAAFDGRPLAVYTQCCTGGGKKHERTFTFATRSSARSNSEPPAKLARLPAAASAARVAAAAAAVGRPFAAGSSSGAKALRFYSEATGDVVEEEQG
jgi:hypothetical protein